MAHSNDLKKDLKSYRKNVYTCQALPFVHLDMVLSALVKARDGWMAKKKCTREWEIDSNIIVGLKIALTRVGTASCPCE